MPEGFRIVDTDADVILPMRFDRSRLLLPTFDFFGVARLKPGVTIAEANADIERMLPIWMDSWPPFPGGNASFYAEVWQVGPAIRALKHDVVGNVGNVLWVVMGTIAVVLVIACANVTNLLLVRASARERDLAVRAALGAGAWRISRALLLESVILGLAGGVLGLGLAQAALKVLLAIGPTNLPRLAEVSLDARCARYSRSPWRLIAGFLLGLAPALEARRPRDHRRARRRRTQRKPWPRTKPRAERARRHASSARTGAARELRSHDPHVRSVA